MPKLFGEKYNKLRVADYGEDNTVSVEGVKINCNNMKDLVYTAAQIYISGHILYLIFDADEPIEELKHCLTPYHGPNCYECEVIDLFRLMGNAFVDKVIEAKVASAVKYLNKAKVVETKSARNV